MKKFCILSIITLGLVLLLPQQADAQNNVSVWDGNAEFWTQGSGTANNPFLIENARQLAFLAELVNAGTTYENTYFKLQPISILTVLLHGNP